MVSCYDRIAIIIGSDLCGVIIGSFTLFYLMILPSISELAASPTPIAFSFAVFGIMLFAANIGLWSTMFIKQIFKS
jgi:hypothetical protein